MEPLEFPNDICRDCGKKGCWCQLTFPITPITIPIKFCEACAVGRVIYYQAHNAALPFEEGPRKKFWRLYLRVNGRTCSIDVNFVEKNLAIDEFERRLEKFDPEERPKLRRGCFLVSPSGQRESFPAPSIPG